MARLVMDIRVISVLNFNILLYKKLFELDILLCILLRHGQKSPIVWFSLLCTEKLQSASDRSIPTSRINVRDYF